MVRTKSNTQKKTAGQKKAAEIRQIFPRPGVIQEIVSQLTRAHQHGKTLTVEQILTKLAKKFPDRDIAGMEITVRAQLSRLPKERGLEVIKERNGKNVGYAIAA